ncbi:MAG: type II toxin-antitoxin system RelE/ParE family toxin, partial [Gammaproteobacteria bacterium]
MKAAQFGEKHPDAKALRGFGHAGVIEIVEICEGDAYRAVYTARFNEAIYVLHAFQKKSTRGIATSRRDVALIEERFKVAEQLHRHMM